MSKKSAHPLVIIAAIAAVSAGMWNGVNSANASAFHHWTVQKVAYNDVLNVRKYPSSKSSILTFHKNGESLQMTGSCTGGINLDHLGHLAPWQQEQAVRYQWCKVWSPAIGGSGFVEGWVYGKYIQPGS